MVELKILDEDINIIQLDFPDNVRLRPGKLIGPTDNPDVLLREIVDNAIDEVFGSTKTDFIYVKIPKTPDEWHLVADNGRGIPILWDNDKQKTKVEMAVSTLDTGSKFYKSIDKVAVGLNGVGSSAVNGLSNRFIILSKVTSKNYDKSIPLVKTVYNRFTSDTELFYFLEYEKGIKLEEGCLTKDECEERWHVEFPNGMSTVVFFQPDDQIFKEVIAKYPMKNLAYLNVVTEKFYNKSVRVVINNIPVSEKFIPYKYEFTKRITETDYRGNVKSAQFYINFELDNNMSVVDYSGSVNTLNVDQGIHINMARDAYSKAIADVYNLTHKYTNNGLHLNVIVVAGEVDFSSQTKERCVKLDGLSLNEGVQGLYKEFKKIIKDNSDTFDQHSIRLNEYAESLVKISTINKVKSMLNTEGASDSRSRSKIDISVKDAATNNRKTAELFIVEGKSASGNILKTRNRDTQALIELRGVPLNAINVDLDEFLNNKEMYNIIHAIGVGVNEYYNLKNPRYGKIIIAADSDPDGYRIASLILGMFAKKLTFLIESGMVYVLESALYKQDGKFLYPDEEHLLDRSRPFTRFKGLGELNIEDTKYMITDPSTRRLRQITLEDVSTAFELLTLSSARKQLMIDKEVLVDPFKLGLYS